MDILTVPLDLINHHIADDGTVRLTLDGINLTRPFTIHASEESDPFIVRYCWPNVQPDGEALEGDCEDEPIEFRGTKGCVWWDPIRETV